MILEIGALCLIAFLSGFYHQSRKPRPKPNKFVLAVEGNISSGKSTFVQALYDLLGSTVQVIFEAINRILLDQFLKNQKKYATLLQMVRMARRLHELESTQWMEKQQIIVDRSVMGDLFFALNHFLSGNMDFMEMKMYTEEMKLNDFFHMIRSRHLSAMLYVHSDPHVCRERVNQRGNVDKDTKEDYLNVIDHIHFYGILYLVAHQLLPIYVTTHELLYAQDKSQQQRKAVELYQSIVSGWKRTAKIRWVTRREAEIMRTNGENCFIATWDGPGALEPLPNEQLSLLPKEWRFKHNQAWKNEVMNALASPHPSIVFVCEKGVTNQQACIYQLFQQLPRWETFLDTFQPKQMQMDDVKQ